MEKVKIDFQIPEKKTVKYKGLDIEITPFLTVGQQIYLINNYVNDFYNELGQNFVEMDEYNYLKAEFNMFSYLVQLLTNIDPQMPNDVYGDTEFISIFEDNIENYSLFRHRLNKALNNIATQKRINNAVGPVISNLVEKGYDILEGFSDISPEEIEKLQEKGSDMLKQLEASSLIKESKQHKKGE